MMRGSEGATAMAPMEPGGWSSKMGAQERPASVVFQTPPLLTPMKKVLGWSGMPAAPTVRPPRWGPMQRQRRESYEAGSIGGRARTRAARMASMSRFISSGALVRPNRAYRRRVAVRPDSRWARGRPNWGRTPGHELDERE